MLLLASLMREREKIELTLSADRHQLAHATRLAAAGELSGMLANELRQPLTAILANAQAARMTLAQPDANLADVREMLAAIEQQEREAAGAIAQLQRFVQRERVKVATPELRIRSFRQ